MTQEITIRGRKFTVEPKTRVDREGKLGRFFELHGPKGAYYFTMANIRTGLHFVVNAKATRSSGLPFDGVWLRDNNGVLEVAKQ